MKKSKVLENIKKLKECNTSLDEIIKFLIKTGDDSNKIKNFLIGKYDDILESYLRVRKGKTVCKNCFQLNPLGTFYCPNPDCTLYNEKRKEIPKKSAMKTAKTKLERYGNAKFNNIEKVKISLSKSDKGRAAEKRKQTNMERYGVEHASQCKEVKEKARQTCLKRYGCNSPTQSSEILEKVKQTNMERYGVEHASQCEEIKEKIKKTNLERYGYECNLKSPEIKEKIKQTTLKRYQVENPLKSPEIKKKIKQTNLERYHVEYASQSPEIKEKTKQTNLKRYQVENPLKSPENKEKIKQTNLKRYQVEHPMQSLAVREKTKQTCLEKYGVEYTFQSPEIKEHIKESNLKKFGVVNPSQSPLVKEKVKETCKARYGCVSPSQHPEVKERTKESNLKKYGTEYPTQSHYKNYNNLNEQFVRETFIDSEGFFDLYAFMDYFNTSYSTAINYKHEFNILNPNKVEIKKTQNFLFNNIKAENKILNDRKILNGLELDIFLPDFNLAIEFNGLMFHSQGLSDYKKFNTPDYPKNYHLNKLRLCESKGIKLFHIFEGENLDLWLSMINNQVGLNQRIYARQTTIGEPSKEEIYKFLNENHTQGFCRAKINLGLYHNDILVSLMTFSKPRFNKNYQFELVRFCSSRNTTVVGAASKLFNYFINQYKPASIISYANRRFSQGDIYKKLGFTLKGESEPNYFYFKPGNLILESRTKYQKHRLESLSESGALEYFNASESEKINMFKNGFRRIYDCGNLIFEFIRES